uniref:Secreted protein n=1 Tax=Mesocestoides corti TaxID=53468 RepID=A0A5K3FMF7_MESCO
MLIGFCDLLLLFIGQSSLFLYENAHTGISVCLYYIVSTFRHIPCTQFLSWSKNNKL